MITTGAQLIVLTCALGLGTPDGPSEPAQFRRIMETLLSPVRDVSFVFEGESHPAGAGGLTEAESQRTTKRFQGNYSLRSDGAGLLESFVYRGTDNATQAHWKRAVLKGKLEDSRRMPPPGAVDPARFWTSGGGPGSLGMSPSPESIVFLWYFYPLINLKSDHFFYKNLGWDEVEGRRCLHVALGRPPGSTIDRNHMEMWIDLERGGHPLQVEQYRGESLESRIDQIILGRITGADKAAYWFPVAGRVSSFQWEGRHYDSPVFVRTMAIVPSSIRINQGLPDSKFSARPSGALPGTPEPARKVREARLELMSPYPTDPASVQERLDQNLAEAARQAKEVKASSPARTVWSSTLIAQLIFGGLGVVLAAVGLRRWRSR